MKQPFNSMRIRIVACLFISVVFVSLVIIYYYYTFRLVVNKQVNANFEQVSQDIEAQLSERLNVIARTAKTIGYSTSVQNHCFSVYSPDRIRNRPAAFEVISNSAEIYPYIRDIFFYVNSHTYLYSSEVYTNVFLSDLSKHGLSENIQFEEPFFSEPIYLINKAKQLKPYFIYYAPINDVYGIVTRGKSGNAAICAVLFDVDSLFQVHEDDKKVIYALIYNDRFISSNQEVDEEKIAHILTLEEGQGSFRHENIKYLTYSAVIPESKWKIVCMLPENSVLEDLFSTRNSLFIIIILGTIIIVLLMMMVVRSISSSVNAIITDVNALDLKSSNKRIRCAKLLELQLLSDRINQMLDRIETATKKEQQAQKKLYDIEIAHQKAEFTAYRSQINPHFLFNTMECLRSMANHYNAEPIEELVTSMAKLFHYSLYSSMMVPFSQELNHVEHYVKIMSFRYPGRYELRKKVSPEIMDLQIPSMVMQPLVENSIIHGFKNHNKKAPCIILIKAHVDSEGFIHIEITDNGCGISQDNLNRINSMICCDQEEEPNLEADSIGILNISKRLKLFSSYSDIQYKSKEKYYTSVRLVIPTGES